MPRRNLVPFRLDPARAITEEQLRLILRAADDIIARGGRTLLTDILKGSRQKKLLEYGLDGNPSYGALSQHSRDEVLSLVDRAIVDGYLRVEYSGDLPVIVYTEKGWDIGRGIRVRELLADLDDRLAGGPPYDMTHLVDRNRQMILDLLGEIQRSRRPELIPVLRAWQEIDYKKVRTRIESVIRTLEKPAIHLVSKAGEAGDTD